MKKRLLYLPLCIFTFSSSTVTSQAQTQTFGVQGNKIVDPCGNVFVPRGVNYSLLDDWEFPGNLNATGTNAERSAEILKANPNMVRIQWYANYGNAQRPAYTLMDLDSVISRFERAGVTSMLELHDGTCAGDYSILTNTIVPYWTSAPMKALLLKHRKSTFLNIANELGSVNFSGGGAALVTNYQNAYKAAITTLRTAGITQPIVIDAPDCGVNETVAIQCGSILLQHDPLHNVIMSAHAYWGETLGNDSLTLRSRLTAISNASVPILLGEVANWQDDYVNGQNVYCAYSILSNALLNSCQDLNIGWLAWTWTKDNCAARQMTANGLFSSLGAWGNAIYQHPNFGLKTKAIKTQYALNGFACGSAISATSAAVSPAFSVLQNATTTRILIETSGTLTVYDATGREIFSQLTDANTQLTLPSFAAGLYVLVHRDAAGRQQAKKLIQ